MKKRHDYVIQLSEKQFTKALVLIMLGACLIFGSAGFFMGALLV